MAIDRAKQLEILNKLLDVYPASISVRPLIQQDPALRQNLHYLAEHKLIEGNFINLLDGGLTMIEATITAKGIDFLADDGGVSAILGVVTVRLHQDTIRQLLVDRVNSAQLPPEEKATLIERIRALPGKGLEKLTEKMLEKGADGLLEQAPRLLDLLSQIG